MGERWKWGARATGQEAAQPVAVLGGTCVQCVRISPTDVSPVIPRC